MFGEAHSEQTDVIWVLDYKNELAFTKYISQVTYLENNNLQAWYLIKKGRR